MSYNFSNRGESMDSPLYRRIENLYTDHAVDLDRTGRAPTEADKRLSEFFDWFLGKRSIVVGRRG